MPETSSRASRAWRNAFDRSELHVSEARPVRASMLSGDGRGAKPRPPVTAVATRRGRLRRSDCSGPGLRRSEARPGVRLTSTRTRTGSRTRRCSSACAASPSRPRGARCGSARTPWAIFRPPGSTPPGASSTCTTRGGARTATDRSSRRWSASAARCPKMRRRVRADLERSDEPTHQRVLACAVRLLDVGVFRIGSEEYADDEGGYGLATIRKEHVTIDGDGASFDYLAKGGNRRRPGDPRPAHDRADPHPQAPARRRPAAARLPRRAALAGRCAPRRSTTTSRRCSARTSAPRTSEPGTRP